MLKATKASAFGSQRGDINRNDFNREKKLPGFKSFLFMLSTVTFSFKEMTEGWVRQFL